MYVVSVLGKVKKLQVKEVYVFCRQCCESERHKTDNLFLETFLQRDFEHTNNYENKPFLKR